jgi:hypothetical protein
VLVAALVIGTTVTGQSTARFTYPFLDGAPLRAPDILYMPSYFPEGGQHLSFRFGPNRQGIDFELRLAVASGDELVIWESTRGDASVEEAVGRYDAGTKIHGPLTEWRAGRVAASGAALVYARIGQTLVVITGPLTIDELVRIGDSLRQGSPSSLML